MRLRRWLALLGVVVGLGCLQVAQRNATVVKGYALGDRLERIHAQQTDLSRLRVEVTGLSSPAHLAQVAKDRRLKLVAWSAVGGGPLTAAGGMQAQWTEPALTAVASVDRQVPLTDTITLTDD